MTPIARADAYAAGRARFFTGRACHAGHIAERYVASGNCVECARENSRAFSGKALRRKTPGTVTLPAQVLMAHRVEALYQWLDEVNRLDGLPAARRQTTIPTVDKWADRAMSPEDIQAARERIYRNAPK